MWTLYGRAWAATIDVPDDHPTIGEAVAASASGDTIQIAADGGPYTETVLVPHALTFRGVDRPRLQGDSEDDGFFLVDGPFEVTVEGLDLDGRGAYPALRLLEGSVVLRDVVVSDCAQDGAGGALYAGSNATLLALEDSVVRDSRNDGGTQSGGLIAVLGGDLRIERTALLRGRTARYGGLVWYDGEGSFTLTDSVLEAGFARDRGGAVATTGPLSVSRSWFRSNETEREHGGGALYLNGPGPFEIEDSWWLSNVAGALSEGGGALYVRAGAVTVAGSVFCDNVADEGGAVRVHAGTADLTHSVSLNNEATTAGGLFWNNGDGNLAHVSSSGDTAPQGSIVRSRALVLSVLHSYLADAGPGLALDALSAGQLTVDSSALWNNAGDYNAHTVAGALLTGDSLLGPVAGCDPLSLRPPAGSPLLDGASDGTDIGAFDGDDGWPDRDGDGLPSLFDCDDDDSSQGAPLPEVAGDGLDQDCDGFELCWLDIDLDGHGEEQRTYSQDPDCSDPGEAPLPDDLCPGGDDDLDPDGDGLPSACDDCPLSATGDSDLDGVCDDADLCPGSPETDGDGDGNPDACDPCPLDLLDDRDTDGVCDSDDLCPGQDDQLDTDSDGVPNGCEQSCLLADTDGDGVPDDCDVCAAGDDGFDYDNDLQPDACDACPMDSPDDSDGDSICDSDDRCEGADDALDADGDDVPDPCDPCPADPGDDSDGDGSCDSDDPCPLDAPGDTDADGSCDSDDLCPGQDDRLDGDGDQLPDGCDDCAGPGGDIDADSVCDGDDRCPDRDDRLDSDSDQLPDGCDDCPQGACAPREPGLDDLVPTVGCACDSSAPGFWGLGPWTLLGACALLLRRRA